MAMGVNVEDLVFALDRAHDLVRGCEDEIFGRCNLTTEQYMVLAAIKCLKKPVRITDLAIRLTRSVNSVSMIIDRMVKAGLINRVRDEKDRRTVFVSITGKAEERFKPACLAYQEVGPKMLSQLSIGDQQTLLRLLEILQRSVVIYRYDKKLGR
jgi:DNA-binding MarR family transcriptional regulator